MRFVWRACFQLIPIALYVCYAYTFMFLGVYALIEDHAVRDGACGKTFLIWTYCTANVVFCFAVIVTYCVWRGGGEGARVRAMFLLIMYFALLMWGLLMLQRMTRICANIFSRNFKTLYMFYEACLCTNGTFFLLFSLHEGFVGKYVGSDLTIMANLRHRYNSPQRATQKAPLAPVPPTELLKPPQTAAAAIGLPPQLSYEYEKIMAGAVFAPMAGSGPVPVPAASNIPEAENAPGPFPMETSASLPQTTP